jgi:hypothetical protein
MAGNVTAKGYRRIKVGGRQVMEHVYVWERHNGRPVPDGHDIHHRDGDKLNNDLANLQLVTKLEHKRIHSGCELRDGEWWKPCGICRRLFPITEEHFYLSPEGWPLYGRCRKCHIAKVVNDKRVRKLRRAQAV